MADATYQMPDGAPGSGPGPRTLDTMPFSEGFRRNLGARPPLTVVGVMAAVAGALLASAALVAIGLADDPSPWVLIAIGLALVVVGWAGGLVLTMPAARVRFGDRAAELVPAATVLAVLGAPAVAIGLVVRATADSNGPTSESIAWWPTLVVAVLLLALWVVPGLQGRPAVLAIGLVFATWSLAALVAVTVGTTVGPRQYSSDGVYYSTPSPFEQVTRGLSDGIRAGAVAALAAGIVFLVLAALADRSGLPGLGTPLIVAGVIGGTIGAYAVTPDQPVLRALIPLMFVLVVVVAGVLGGRKATTWFGALLSVAAIGQLALAVAGDRPKAGVVAALLAVVGLALLVTAAWLGARLARPGVDAVAPPAPPAATAG